MAENNQLSDETKNNSTDTSSTDASSAVIGNHENAIVPHKISNHDKLVQTMVMVDGEWINVNDTNDQANTKEDMHKVNKKVVEAQKGIVEAKNTADSAVKYADSAVSASKVNSDALVAQSSAISEAKAATDSAAAEIQQLKANTASDAANIRADVAKVESEVASAKSANQDSINALQSDIDATKNDLVGVQSGLSSAQAAIGQNQKLINDSVAKINNDIEQDRKDLAAAQQANSDTAAQLSDYAKQAADQGKTIKSLQDDGSSMKATIADINGNVSQVQDSVSGLSASLKDTQGNLATVKGLADSLNATITDHSKNISALQATAQSLSSTLSDADGRLSKVEQTAEEQSTTLSTVQGNLSQVKQTADSLTDTLKDAQGDIASVQATAKGLSEQITNTQGAITDLQTDVTGVKAIIADHDKNIHTLQADSETLKDDMADTKGNISGLQKTATSLTSEMQDHLGRISKVEQTASTLTNEFSDQQGRLNRVEQTAAGTQQTVANQQGQINIIRTDASGIHETLTGQGKQIATINTTLDGLNTKYEGFSDNLSKLSGTVATNSTQIGQNKKSIDLKADQTTVNNLSSEVSQNKAQLKVQADQISSKVSSEDFKTLDNKVGGVIAQIDKNTTAIDQTNKQISLKADQTEVNQVKQTATQNSSRLNVMANEIQSKVTSTDVNNIVDSKGYATTSTVQSLITQKAGTINESITQLDTTFKTGMENSVQLVRKSDFEDGSKGGWTAQAVVSATNPAPPAELGPSGMKVLQTHVRDAYEDGIWYSVKPDEKFDVDYWCAPSSAFHTTFGLVFTNKDKENWNWLGINSDQSGQWKHYTGTITAPANAAFAKPWYQMKKPADNTTDTSWIAKPSIRRQNASTVSAIQNIQVSVDGLKSTVASKADESQVTQLSNLVQSKVSSSDFNSKITQLAKDINLRVTKGDLLSQINIAAGHTLIQSNKIYFDADSFVMSPNSTAFIPSAYITDINADKINTGTLHSITINNGNGTFRVDPNGNVYANSMHVNNGSIYQGTVLGADVYSISNLTSNSLDKVNDATQNWVKLKDGTIELHGANGNHYSSIMPVDVSTSWNIEGSSDQQQHGLGILDSQEIIIGQAALYSDDNNRITHSTNLSMINRTNLTISGSGIQATLAPDWGDGKGARFSIQKDSKVGFYVGGGDDGNELNVITAGTGNRIAVSTSNFDIDGEVNIKNNHGLTAKNVHVTGWLGVDGSKNSIVRTSQGTVAINAYETAEYYFGDIGEGQTDSNGVAYVGIEKLFNETVNTSIPYQVFITAYGPGNVWVEQRKQDRFMVRSSQPNIKFGWEIKAKRKGYEHTRLQNVDNKLNHMEATS